ncbi:hypothetical protein J2W32_006524 [Variovorax boronicumulans]|uniref:UrcA family protein n=1 Tax=Variovorax boronicumulans TaxID=436515 RepID=A0AAW8D7S2_9BURK|nr:hypothetical protein [Variovorax boronicumulans]MDP9897411.1 hypothetical protein [Variovorax boronicumulans]MDQ0057447.1 hypothetical protein [Variovorax boronicumulans]
MGLAALQMQPAAAQIPVTGDAALIQQTVADAEAAFYKDREHCANMAAVVEYQDPRETARFESDIAAAVGSIRRQDPTVSYNLALLTIKAACDEKLWADAGVAGNGSSNLDKLKR